MMAASGKDDSQSKLCKNSEGCEKIAISPRESSNREIYRSFKGPERLMAVTSEDCIDSKVYIQKVTVATSNATGLSGQGFSQESRKRKHQELHLNEKDSLIQSFSDFQKVLNSLQHSIIVSTFFLWLGQHQAAIYKFLFTPSFLCLNCRS